MTSAKPNAMTAHAARCSSAAVTGPSPPSGRSKLAVPSLRNSTRNSRAAASRAVVSTQKLVLTPPMMSVSMPRERRMTSRSVPWKLPKRGFPTTTSSRRMSMSGCRAAAGAPSSISPCVTGGTNSPRSPVLLPPGRTTCRVQITMMPASRLAAASSFSRPATSLPRGAATGDPATKQFCMSTITSAVRLESTSK